ncbi:betaine/proline/choline family ABC transporter ATP-binding protein [Sporosarcina jiandibaonis]|uniref:betaine/proline/choline family ABC transporter ATP-binding protein n=1 Tax=Sporosarcina jiandibaonis TaxID=2715535 RepID=UPI00155720E4|nr:betaine/proline/choline family ABC transporter ATP-binding protein [Sporosarcina jiandibaonis]
MIKFEGVRKVYNDFTAVKDFSFQIGKGELVALIGPSGCGKTTGLRMINRLIEPTSGKILIDGEDIARKDPVELRREIGYVIQQIGLLPHITIGKNIGLVPKLKGWKEKEYINRVDELLDMVGLDPNQYRDRYPSELSGGQQQRVGVIRALAAEPPIILMDEPFSALDPISREQLQDELVRLQKEINKTIVFVTHDMDEALKIADKVAVIQNGCIVQFDSPENIIKHPANSFVEDFIGEKRLKMHNEIGKPEKKLTASDVMDSHAVGEFSEYSVTEGLALIDEINTDCLAIIGFDKELLGIVTRKSLENNKMDGGKKLKELIDEDVITINCVEGCESVISKLIYSNIEEFLVIKNHEVVGVITKKSILKYFAKQ